MTYLELVNEVLARLRESQVSSVAQTPYATLIGKFVNEAKRQVEDSWAWDCLNQTFTVTTVSGTSDYVVTGIGRRFHNVTVNDDTNNAPIGNIAPQWIRDQQLLSTVQMGPPIYYAWNGSNGTDSKIEFYPTPDGTYSIKVNAFAPQADLASDSTILTVQSEAVIANAYARALVERGEDGGLSSSEAYGLYKGILADQIALEVSRTDGTVDWVAC